ncbi:MULTISPECIES: acyl-CoA dehydrogenase family protein [Rhodococcus]|uniref:Acyl-CoA dehydrogenase family protein n=1 Tax=Rhodococcus opacus TaxID=37919 RepID=A0AAX3Y9E4_RHOOP|nr:MULTISPECIES: acyl-CoA dehydrogenase family protein [Rhodococcus]NHU41769.1 acyl-CoA/acyl-ACP dehydrogenase [Rhodococcus sp. A14]MCZ4586323.1 acyl-CoA/acyl-ACP dehydrogenase [Rhodococcus opacus]MDI9940481.1 acyl-CoA dehydrogenase family protein [Rhodococcus sp. IEGM 1351]RKM76371.1 isovaleryl-CoA dehydrogenase [Rhodococcus opacus]UZG53001.1 acyl-CoA/acyl-ACP dehydrogenase [Rhodococcus opacus]
MDFQLNRDQLDLQNRAEAVGASFRGEAREWDESDNAPYNDIFERIRAADLLGIAMPTEYGGQGGGAIEYLVVVEALFRNAQSWLPSEPVFCTSGPGPSMLLLGDAAVKEKYLHDIVAGRRACNIALTEPDAGSALTHLTTTAVRDGHYFVLNGTKSYVTGSNVNDLNATFVRFDDIPGAKGIGAVVVDTAMDGVTVQRGPTFIGDRGIAHGNLILEDVRVPAENLIVGPGQFARLMTAFNLERLHNCGFWLGFSQAAYDEASTYVQQREAFGRPVVEFQAVYHTLADMWVQIEALRLLAYRAAADATDGRFPRLAEVTQAKLFGATIGPQISLKALELHGGYGVTTDFPIQRIHRDCVTNVVAGGAPAVMRNGVAAGLFPHRKFPQT